MQRDSLIDRGLFCDACLRAAGRIVVGAQGLCNSGGSFSTWFRSLPDNFLLLRNRLFPAYDYCGLPLQVDKVAVTNILPVEKTTMAGKLPDGKLDTVIGPGTTVKGDLHVTGGLRLDGQIEGEVDVGETFLAGPKSLLKGGLRCRDAVIAGRIEANIVAAETTELQAGAHVIGNIECKGLVIQKGSYFQGSCIMSKDQDNPTIAPPQEDRQ